MTMEFTDLDDPNMSDEEYFAKVRERLDSTGEAEPDEAESEPAVVEAEPEPEPEPEDPYKNWLVDKRGPGRPPGNPRHLGRPGFRELTYEVLNSAEMGGLGG